MPSSVSRQNEPNCMPRLATQVGNMELSCPLRTTHCIPQEKFPSLKTNNKSFSDHACSVKMAGYQTRSFLANLKVITSLLIVPFSVNNFQLFLEAKHLQLQHILFEASHSLRSMLGGRGTSSLISEISLMKLLTYCSSKYGLFSFISGSTGFFFPFLQ